MVAAVPPPPAASVVHDDVSLDGQHTFVSRGRVVILRDGWDPVWSPDGRFVAAFHGRGIAVVTPDGRVVRRVRTVGSTSSLTWSPDGRWFAYVAQHCADPAGHEDPACGTLWVVRVDGTGQRRASREGAVSLVYGFERPYAWAPDGRRIAYVANRGLVVADILSGHRHLLGPSAHGKAIPDWSPDGKRLLYTYGEQLVTSAPDGSDRRLVHGAADTLLAAWSPDGTRIAYIRDVGGQRWQLFVAGPDGSRRIRVSTDVSDAPLIWSRDGAYLLVGSPGGDRYAIVRADGSGRAGVVCGGENGDWRG